MEDREHKTRDTESAREATGAAARARCARRHGAAANWCDRRRCRVCLAPSGHTAMLPVRMGMGPTEERAYASSDAFVVITFSRMNSKHPFACTDTVAAFRRCATDERLRDRSHRSAASAAPTLASTKTAVAPAERGALSVA